MKAYKKQNIGRIGNIYENPELLKENMKREENLKILAGAIIWHLNNKDKDGNPTTQMNIPNEVWNVLEKKIAQMPTDRRIEESEALEIVRKQ